MNNAPNDVMDLLNQGVQNGLFSGAQWMVSEKKHTLAAGAVGNTYGIAKTANRFCSPQPINQDTLFDIASITKPLATAALILKASDEGSLKLDQKLVSIIDSHCPPWLLSYTITDLLTHATPLPAWFDFFHRLTQDMDHATATHNYLREIAMLEPRNDPSPWCYSDIGYILLGFILESTYKKSLAQLFDEKITRPLGLEHKILYTPLHHTSRHAIAATANYQGAFIQGHPDDDNARSLTHIAGHAGLFAAAKSIHAYIGALLNKSFPLKPNTLHKFLTYKAANSPYTLGWDRPTSNDSLSGRAPGDPVIGHLGFTGCSTWIDLESQRIVTLLTNRVHANNDPKSLAPLRREIYRIAWNL